MVFIAVMVPDSACLWLAMPEGFVPVPLETGTPRDRLLTLLARTKRSAYGADTEPAISRINSGPR